MAHTGTHDDRTGVHAESIPAQNIVMVLSVGQTAAQQFRQVLGAALPAGHRKDDLPAWHRELTKR